MGHKQLLNAAYERCWTFCFRNYSIQTSRECCSLDMGIGKSRKHHNRDRGHTLLDYSRCINPVQSRHHEVHHNEIGMELLGFVDALAAIFGFSAYSPIGLLCQ